MNRRELMQMIAAVTGTTLIGAERALAWDATATGTNLFTEADAAFLDEVAEVLIPETDTPGARAAGVGAFMTVYVSDCLTAAEQARFRQGMDMIGRYAEDVYGAGFLTLDPGQRLALLEDIAAEARIAAKGDDDAVHWFTPIHQLTLLGFFTSETGATEVLRYEAVPGEYNGDLAYDGGPAWAT